MNKRMKIKNDFFTHFDFFIGLAENEQISEKLVF